MKPLHILLILAAAALAACAPSYTPMEFTVAGDRLIAVGDIDGNTQARFEKVIRDNPNVSELALLYVGGSVDDEANLVFARSVRDLGLDTRVPANGLVASGGTDLFLAGVHRVLEPGACVGVHEWTSWAYSATDLERSDPLHQEYLDYFTAIGTDPEFYWFTLDAAKADDMHWMTAKEAARFDMTTRPVAQLGTETMCLNR